MNHFPASTKFFRLLVLAALFLAASAPAPAGPDYTDILPPGFAPLPRGIHALVGAKVWVNPGRVLTNATVVIRDGYIQAVGPNIPVPVDARVWDMKGLTVYAGFIEPYLVMKGEPEPKSKPKKDDLTAGGVNFYGIAGQETESGGSGGPGYEVAQVQPQKRVAEHYVPDEKELEELRGIGFTAAIASPSRGIIRGTSALVALSDADANHAVILPDVFQNICFSTEHMKQDVYPISLMGVIAAVRQSFLDADHYRKDLEDYAKRPGQRKRPAYDMGMDALAFTLEKKRTVLFEPTDALMVDRAKRIAGEMNLDFCIVSSGQEWRRPDLAKSAAVPFIVPLNFPKLPKMPDEDDWDQVTLDEMRAWDWAPENPAVLQNQGLPVALTTYGLEDKKDFRPNLLLARDRGLAESNALAALTTVPAKLCGMENLLGAIEAGRIANLTVVDGAGYFDKESKVQAVWIDGRYYDTGASGKKDAEKSAKKQESADDKTKPEDAAAKKKKDEEKQARLKELQKRVARAPLEGRGVITNPPAVLIRNATLWTCGPQGILTNTDLLAQDGVIKALGTNLDAPAQALVIDGAGLFVTPGLIDCHSHSMILGDVNEGTLPSSAMVRIGDVVNSESENIYEQLAGGLTEANLLHGSANPIGGQICLIKLRDGETPEGLKFAGAIPGIKFALGENVKQSNWGEKYVTRFPQTRMGVRTFYENRFTAARQYLKEWDEFKKSGGLAPRRDLELEAIGEILQGQRLIHCHSYRQDEILMLMRVMEEFGVKIGTFQHVLEGYKVADEIAKHGAGGSSFADWWAYKFEVYDAIPQNGSLMRERGVLVSFNSDSSDLARRLYLEAAKAVKFGGTPEPEALKFVTINPAKQLQVDKRVGSLEPGKDADFAIWSKPPLDSGTVCLQTWIEGKKYFDRSLSGARAAALEKERNDLLAKAHKLSHGGGDDGGKDADSKQLFFKKSLEHEYDGVIRHCLGESDDD
jgi:imidazolonepropionase-like amidohydrolase